MTGRARKYCKYEQRRELLGKSPEGNYKGRSLRRGRGSRSRLAGGWWMTGRAGKYCKYEQRRELLGKSPEGR